jgi:hypothetical protein
VLFARFRATDVTRDAVAVLIQVRSERMVDWGTGGAVRTMRMKERLAALEREHEQAAREVALLREELAARQAEEQLRALVRQYAHVLREIADRRQPLTTEDSRVAEEPGTAPE